MWERSFLGISVLLGASATDALGMLPEESHPSLADTMRTLDREKRATRAEALARAAREVLVAVDGVTLR